MNNTKLLSDQFKGLQSAIGSMPDDAPLKPTCQSFLDDAISLLGELQEADTHAYEVSERLALLLTNLATCFGGHYASVIADQAEKAGEKARIANSQTELYASVARAKAAEVWSADANRQEYCLAEVVSLLREVMLREGFSIPNQRGVETLTISRIRNWIAPFAPEYARRPGRRKASP